MKKAIVIGLLSFTLLITACASGQGTSQNQGSGTALSSTQSAAAASKTFTLTELKKYDGQNGNPAYVAVNGIVYDVSNARNWNNGQHQGGAVAGIDLSNLINSSPHGSSVLSKLPVVGKLA